jgi:hypothetical protein
LLFEEEGEPEREFGAGWWAEWRGGALEVTDVRAWRDRDEGLRRKPGEGGYIH